MAHYGFNISMFDVSKQLIDFAKWRMDRRGFQYKAFLGDQNWISGESPYEFILALDVIEHVANPFHTVSRLTKMLNIGGLLCVSVPSTPVYDRPMHLDYYKRDLLADARILGLHHIMTLTYIDIFMKVEEVSNVSKHHRLTLKKETFIDLLLESILNPLFENSPQSIIRLVAIINRALTAFRQTFFWFTVEIFRRKIE
jgi:2-polyprenyl-3-methyl-5-hydroxy-6-metoxy-1,4-benzoquinol methylase